MMRFIGWLLGIDDLERIDRARMHFTAGWADGAPVLLVLLLAGLVTAAVVFYRRFQPSIDSPRLRWTLTVMRALVLVLIALLLAQPVVSLATAERFRPLLLLLFDGTQSMAIADGREAGAGEGLSDLIELSQDADPDTMTRADWVRAVVSEDKLEVLSGLDKRYRLRAYVMDRADRVREVDVRDPVSGALDTQRLAEGLTTEGQVSAYGAAIEDLHRRHQAHRLAGVVVVGDFSQNAGPPAPAAVERFGRPVHTVGVGPTEVSDLAVELRTPMLLKSDEAVELGVRLRQSALQDREATVTVTARRLGADPATDLAEPIGEPVTVTLDAEQVTVPIPFEPDEPGRYLLEARVDPIDGETIEENNLVSREVVVRDQSLRLLFIEHEPTWEWRFIKEVFQRDPLIGEEGFRTFLRSASVKVRRTNPLFLDTLIRPRSEFFSYDVIILSDVPASMLSDELTAMLREYVSRFGGGLVILGGPRFGPNELAGTPLSEMLPVVPAEKAERVDEPFELKRLPAADEHAFMRLAASDEANDAAWENMGPVQWYQPVAGAHPLATVLAAHPTDRTADGEQPQPIVAMRRFGRGEVVYFAFNETWRLRRLHGERYHRRLWGQLIYRLGLGRALGEGKRFVVRTDRRQYRGGDKALVSVEAYSRDFGELDQENLTGKLIVEPFDAPGTTVESPLVLPIARDRVIFETAVPVFAAGRYRVVVDDPVTGGVSESSFSVTDLSIEQRSATRDQTLQDTLSGQTGGASLTLDRFAELPDLLDHQAVQVTTERQVELGATGLLLWLVLLLMFGEWLIRKLSNLR